MPTEDAGGVYQRFGRMPAFETDDYTEDSRRIASAGRFKVSAMTWKAPLELKPLDRHSIVL